MESDPFDIWLIVVCRLIFYFGVAIDESADGLEAVYRELLELELKIVEVGEDAGPGWVCRYEDTIADEDRLEIYKLMAVRFRVEG